MARLFLSFVIFVLVSASSVSSVVAAPIVQYGAALVYPVSLEDGRGLPVTMNHEAIVPIPLWPRWTLPVMAGFGTGTDLFRPAPHTQVGVMHRVSDGLLVGGTIMYRYVPHWEGTPSGMHVVGGSTGPGFFITPEIMLALPLGVAHNLTRDAWSASFTSKLVLTFP